MLRSLPGSDGHRRNAAPTLRRPCATLTCSPPLTAGNAFFKKKQHLKAAGCYTKAARKDPTNPVYQSNLAAALIGLAIARTIGFRVSPEDEARGVDLSEHRESAYAFGDGDASDVVEEARV